MKTGQKFNSLLDVQLPKQNGTTVQCFMVYAAHGVKAYQVSFPTQQTSCPLDFPIRSYDRFSGDCTKGQQPREASRDFSSWWHFIYHNCRNSKVHSHPARSVVPCINTLCISEIRRLLIILMNWNHFAAELLSVLHTLVLLCSSWTCEEIPLVSATSCSMISSTAVPFCVG